MHDRKEERALLKRKLESGRSVHMPAPRRIGKTWTMSRLAGDLRESGWVVVEVDVEGMATPEKFARELCVRIEAQNSIKDRFKAHAIQRLGNLLGGGWGENPLDALGRVDPVEFAETLIASLDASGEKVAIIVDEISYFFLALAEEDAKAAHRFAYQLRALQQRYKNVRWLITGSIGLDTIARRYDLEGAFVDLEIYVLEPFNKEAARSFMRDPAIQQQFNHMFSASDEVLDAMFAELGWLAPYYLRIIANEIRPSIPAQGNAPAEATLEDVENAFARLLQPNRRSEFAVWREHVSKNLPAPDRALARQILDVLAKDPTGERDDTLLAHATAANAGATKRHLQDILGMLVNDGLIIRNEGRYVFRSGLVRRFWQEYEAN